MWTMRCSRWQTALAAMPTSICTSSPCASFVCNGENIARSFALRYTQGFEEAFAPKAQTEEDETNYDELGMVENDQLEMSVAIAGITSKITSQYSLLIMQLTRRMDHLADDEVEISERSNPMGPECLGHAFVEALECADLDIKVRIILLKLFERFVMERLSSYYTEANQMLADAGVLPDLKNVMRRERQAGSHTSGTGRTPATHIDGSLHPTPSYGQAGYSEGADQGFGVIQELLAASRRAMPGGAGVAPGGTPLSTSDVLYALGNAQQQQGDAINIEAIPEVMDLRQVVISHAPQGAAGNAHLASGR